MALPSGILTSYPRAARSLPYADRAACSRNGNDRVDAGDNQQTHRRKDPQGLFDDPASWQCARRPDPLRPHTAPVFQGFERKKWDKQTARAQNLTVCCYTPSAVRRVIRLAHGKSDGSAIARSGAENRGCRSKQIDSLLPSGWSAAGRRSDNSLKSVANSQRKSARQGEG